MTDKQYEILEHDWETLKAKYILGTPFKELENDFIAFCELGFYYALFIYAPTYRIGKNEKVDAIIDAFPDMSKQDIQYAMKFSRGEEKALANRALVKSMRKSKGIYRGLTPSQCFEGNVITNAISEFGGGSEVSDRQYEELVREYIAKSNDRADIRLLSAIVIRKGTSKQIDGQTKRAVGLIANRPYSNYFEEYRKSRLVNHGESGE